MQHPKLNNLDLTKDRSPSGIINWVDAVEAKFRYMSTASDRLSAMKPQSPEWFGNLICERLGEDLFRAISPRTINVRGTLMQVAKIAKEWQEKPEDEEDIPDPSSDMDSGSDED